MPYQMEVPKGYEKWKRKELEKQKKAEEKRRKFEKATEWKTKTYIV